MSLPALPYATFKYEAPIVFLRYEPGTELGFPEIRQLVAYCEHYSGGKPYVTLSDARNEVNITAEGRRYVNNPAHMPLFRGTAVLVKNTMFQFAANFMSQFEKHRYPFRAFTDETKAVKWLRSLSLDATG